MNRLIVSVLIYSSVSIKETIKWFNTVHFHTPLYIYFISRCLDLYISLYFLLSIISFPQYLDMQSEQL